MPDPVRSLIERWQSQLDTLRSIRLDIPQAQSVRSGQILGISHCLAELSAALVAVPLQTTDLSPRVWWEYVGEELAVFWESPYGHGKEKIASFWWPGHPVGATDDVERMFEYLANKLTAVETPPPAKEGEKAHG